jgi:hypothetical protein
MIDSRFIALLVYIGIMILMGIIQRLGHHADKKWAKEFGNGPAYIFWPVWVILLIIAGIGYCLWYISVKPLDHCLKKISNFI